MVTPEQVAAYKADVTNNVDNKTERRSIKKEKIGGFYKTLADWFLDIQGQIVGLIEIKYSDLESDHKTYINTDLSGMSFQIFHNDLSRFLLSNEFSIESGGGFVLSEPMDPDSILFLLGGGITSSEGGSGPSTDTLQDVTDRGNSTNNALQVTGANNLDLSLDGIVVVAGEGTIEIARTAGSAVAGILEISEPVGSEAGDRFSFYSTAGSIVTFAQKSQGIAGQVAQFAGTVAGAPATEENHFVPKSQVQELISEGGGGPSFEYIVPDGDGYLDI